MTKLYKQPGYEVRELEGILHRLNCLELRAASNYTVLSNCIAIYKFLILF